VVGTKPLLGTIIFLLAILTDTFDGYIARKSKQVTKLGMLLDPLADKLLVISALIVLVDMGFIEAWIAIVIIAREFIVTGLRIVALSKDILIPAETGGKIKTTAQFISIVILLIDRSIVSLDLYTMGIALLWFAMLVGIASGIQYFVLFWKRLT
jgi:CDP-diacylglycerol--glycerol-3-phosphate 3-phosphatidyltransferase